jgi:FixJ family two-component response regulator
VTAHPRPVIFVVDDEASVRKGLARLVKIAGYEVEPFASVGEFLARPPHDGAAGLLLDVRTRADRARPARGTRDDGPASR